MSAVIPSGGVWSAPRYASTSNDSPVTFEALGAADILNSLPSSPGHADFQRPVLYSSGRDRPSSPRESTREPAREPVHGGFGQLLGLLASEHEREISALQEELEFLRQWAAEKRYSSREEVLDDLHDIQEVAEPPEEKPPLLESPKGSFHDRHQRLRVSWRPSSNERLEAPGSPKHVKASLEEVSPLPCQVIRVPPEGDGPKQPKQAHLAEPQQAVESSLSDVSDSSSVAARQHSSLTEGMGNHLTQRFTLRPIYEQLSDEEPSQNLITTRMTIASLDSEGSLTSTTYISRCMSKLITHPSSRFRLVWNFLSLTMLVSDIVTVPLQLFDPPDSHFDMVLAVVALIFWNIDCASNFFVGYWEKGAAVLSPRRIASRYLTTWFLPDLSLITVDWVLMVYGSSGGSVGGGRVSRSMKLVRALRYLRLLRLLKTKQMLEKSQVSMSEISSVRFSIGKLVLAILLINHLIGCFWWGVGTMECEGRSWTYAFRDRELWFRYATSFHWSISQFGVGQVEIEAENTCERAFCICVLLFALIAFSSLVSSITNAMAHLRRLNDRDAQSALFTRYCREQRVSNHLLQRMIQHVNAVLDQQRQSIAAVDVAFLKLLSEPLYDELQKEIYERYLLVHPFFMRICSLYLVCTRSLCRHTLTTMFLAPRDLLFHTCQVAHRMYFVEGGLLQYTREHASRATIEVSPPEFFSEPVLWTRWLYYGQMQALEPCELVALGAEQFQEVIKMHPETGRPVTTYARRFVERLNMTEESELSDLNPQRDERRFHRAVGRKSELQVAVERRLSFSRLREWLCSKRSPEVHARRQESDISSFLDAEDITNDGTEFES